MSFSGLTNQIRSSPQRSSRQGAKIDHVILHHSATTNEAWVLDAMVKATKQVSANYVVDNEGIAYGVVDEEDRAWTSGSTKDGGKGAAWDRRSITFEIENESVNGWTVSAAAHEKVAQIVADVARRYGFPINSDTVLGHRDLWTRYRASYATACPGGLNVAAIIARANEINGTPGSTPAPIASSKPTSATPRLVGTTASANGIPGPNYWRLVQAIGKIHGVYPADSPVNGIPGPNTYAAEVRMTAAILLGLGYGISTTAVSNGNPYNGSAKNRSNYVLLGQKAGHARGFYPKSSPENGIDGPNSKKARVRILAEWLNANR